MGQNKKFKLLKEKAEDTPHKLIRTWTKPMIALLANRPAQAESLRHYLERAIPGIGLHIKVNKTKYM